MGLRGPNAQKIKGLQNWKGRRYVSTASIAGGTRVEQVINFIEKLPVTSGTLAGTDFVLRAWQKMILDGIYATDESGKRIVRQALITMPRKNGKTGLTAALALAHLCGPEAEQRGQVYSAAADRNQAALIYNEMKAMINKVPALRNRIVIRDFTKHLEDVETGSIFMALSSDAKTKHGFSASCIIYDELAQAPNRELYDVLTTSTGARAEPLTIVISTQSGDPKHIMSELFDYGVQVRDGVVEDKTFFPCIYAAPETADTWSEATWMGCNPALGDFRSLDEMRSAAEQAKRIPAREAAFRLFYLNQRVAGEFRFIPRAEWAACQSDFTEDSLRGQVCYAGLDLSKKNDLTALVLVFPMEEEKPLLEYFWTAEDGIEEAEKKDSAPYRLWVKQGHLMATPGKVIDYRYIARKLGELSTKFQIATLAFDPWNMDQMTRELEDLGVDLTITPSGQGFKGMASAVTALEDDVLSRRLKHRGNPVMGWCIDNARVSVDPAGNRKFDKRKATGRIDGIVALAMADNACALLSSTAAPELRFV